MKLQSTVLAIALATSLLAAVPAYAAEDQAAVDLSQQLNALDADTGTASLAAYERLQARQAIAAMASARSSQYDAAYYVAQRRVRIAEAAARTEAMQRQIDRLERDRSELILEASRRDAAQARAEAEHLRMQARIQAEEAARLREQATSSTEAMQDIESTLQNVAGAEAAKLRAAREREAELARQEAELLREVEAGSDGSDDD
ncbi:MAG: hypothetical protein ACREO4_02125 [Lysobacter sp.]